MDITTLDCTLRDGGYYNSWNFPEKIIHEYLESVSAAGIHIVELGLRSLENKGFKGACAYTMDDFIDSLSIPNNLLIGVMVNASELVSGSEPLKDILQKLFPKEAEQSRVALVRIASHVDEFIEALPAVTWLKQRGYQVGFNLMQIADRNEGEVKSLAKAASDYPIDVLYFADSMGSLTPERTAQIIQWLRYEWTGPLGIHTHDNLGLALSNTIRAIDEGVTWVDSTMTGMGRGPGNVRTEELVIELASRSNQDISIVKIMQLLREYFLPMQKKCGWGTNPYYYLAGKYGIHPTYIQEMLSDKRFSEEDILSVIEHLRQEGGKKFNANTLDVARHFYHGDVQGRWTPRDLIEGRNIILLGTGPGVAQHRTAIERYIRNHNPIVLALNTQIAVSAELIDFRIASHPVRLLADCATHRKLSQPLITPYSMLPDNVKNALGNKEILDFGMHVKPDTFSFGETYCTIPTSIVFAYSLAIATSGKAKHILLAGFDGYSSDDPRHTEMENVLLAYRNATGTLPLLAVTPTTYSVETKSIYATQLS